jgi:hypothetical protein
MLAATNAFVCESGADVDARYNVGVSVGALYHRSRCVIATGRCMTYVNVRNAVWLREVCKVFAPTSATLCR